MGASGGAGAGGATGSLSGAALGEPARRREAAAPPSRELLMIGGAGPEVGKGFERIYGQVWVCDRRRGRGSRSSARGRRPRFEHAATLLGTGRARRRADRERVRASRRARGARATFRADEEPERRSVSPVLPRLALPIRYLGHGDRIIVVGGISNSTVDLHGDGSDLQPAYSWGQPEMQMLVFELSTLTWCFLELDEPGHGLHGHGAVEHPGRRASSSSSAGAGPTRGGELRTIDVGARPSTQASRRARSRAARRRGDHLRSGSFEAHLDATIKVVNKLKWSRVDRKSRLTPDARYGQIFAAWDPRFHLAIHPNPGSEKRKKKAAREAAEGRQSKLLGGGAVAGIGGEEKKAERELISGPHGALPPTGLQRAACSSLAARSSRKSGPPNADGRPSATGYASGELWLFDVGRGPEPAAERERARRCSPWPRARPGRRARRAGAGAGAGARGSPRPPPRARGTGAGRATVAARTPAARAPRATRCRRTTASTTARCTPPRAAACARRRAPSA